MRILMIESDPFAATGLREHLAGVPDFAVENILCDEQEALTLAQPPDVLIVGFLADQAQHALVEKLSTRHWPTRILVKGEVAEMEEVLALLSAGAHRYFLRGDTPENMEAAIHAVMRRELWVSPKLAGPLFARLISKEEEEEKKLSAREVEVLQLVEKGMSNKEIAVILGRKLKTVKAHLEHIFKKLGVNNRMAACHPAREKGWL